MKKIFLFLILFIFSFSNIFAEETFYSYNVLRNNFLIDFGGLDYKEKSKNIVFYNVDYSLANNIDHSITKIDRGPEILRKVSKEKLLNLIGENKIQIYGNDFRSCFRHDYECIFNPEKYTNSEINTSYSVFSKEDKDIEIKVYPFNPNIYDYDSFNVIEHKTSKENGEKIDKEYEKFTRSPILTFFDSQLEIYDLEISGDLKSLEKKYKVVKTKEGNYMYIPYFVGKVSVKKGENNIAVSYKKYIKLPGKDDFSSGHIIIK